MLTKAEATVAKDRIRLYLTKNPDASNQQLYDVFGRDKENLIYTIRKELKISAFNGKMLHRDTVAAALKNNEFWQSLPKTKYSRRNSNRKSTKRKKLEE